MTTNPCFAISAETEGDSTTGHYGMLYKEPDDQHSKSAPLPTQVFSYRKATICKRPGSLSALPPRTNSPVKPPACHSLARQKRRHKPAL